MSELYSTIEAIVATEVVSKKGVPMTALVPWLLTAALLPALSGPTASRRIDVNCPSERALERAIARAKKIGGEVDIYVHGMCEGNFVIDTDGITLRGADGASGLAAPAGSANRLPVVEVIDAQASLRGLIVRGGAAGVIAQGWNADVVLNAVDVHGQTDVGVYAQRGAQLTLIDSTVHDSEVGIDADDNVKLILQNVTVSDERIGVVVSRQSFAGLSDATITSNREAGLAVYTRSDVNIIGSTFRENGQVHIGAGEWSEVSLLSGVTIGAADDSTPHSLSVIRGAAIASFSTAAIHGDVGALIGGSIQLGNTALNGDLLLDQFATAYVRNAAIAGNLICLDGADAICSATTTQGVIGCPSPTCGPPTAAAVDRPTVPPKVPEIKLPRFDWPRRSRPTN